MAHLNDLLEQAAIRTRGSRAFDALEEAILHGIQCPSLNDANARYGAWQAVELPPPPNGSVQSVGGSVLCGPFRLKWMKTDAWGCNDSSSAYAIGAHLSLHGSPAPFFVGLSCREGLVTEPPPEVLDAELPYELRIQDCENGAATPFSRDQLIRLIPETGRMFGADPRGLANQLATMSAQTQRTCRLSTAQAHLTAYVMTKALAAAGQR